MIDQHYISTLRNLLKTYRGTPRSFVLFMSGSLPASAVLHLRQLSLFAMVCRLKGDPLHQHAVKVLLTLPSTAKSWFLQVRNLHLQYHLPHPLELLQSPPHKESFKKLVKSRVLDHWEKKLRSESALLPSLVYFHPEFLSLTTPHKLWSTASSNMHEVTKAKVQLLFLSSQYPCGKRVRHWSPDNPEGFCSFTPCRQAGIVESPEHLLLQCPAYTNTRKRLIHLALQTKQTDTHRLFVKSLLSNTRDLMQLLLDPSCIPEVISHAQYHGDNIFSDLFYLGRSWCFSIHRERMKMLGKWNFL